MKEHLKAVDGIEFGKKTPDHLVLRHASPKEESLVCPFFLQLARVLCLTSTRNQCDVHGAFARAVQFDQHHRLPSAEHQLAG